MTALEINTSLVDFSIFSCNSGFYIHTPPPLGTRYIMGCHVRLRLWTSHPKCRQKFPYYGDIDVFFHIPSFAPFHGTTRYWRMMFFAIPLQYRTLSLICWTHMPPYGKCIGLFQNFVPNRMEFFISCNKVSQLCYKCKAVLMQRHPIQRILEFNAFWYFSILPFLFIRDFFHAQIHLGPVLFGTPSY